MRRIKLILTVVAVMVALTVLAAAPTWAQQDLADDCVFAGGDTFCDVDEVSAVYDFGDCFFIGNDLFCRVIRFDGFAHDFGLFGFDAVDRVDFDHRVDVDLDDDLGKFHKFDFDDVDDDNGFVLDDNSGVVQRFHLDGDDDITLRGSEINLD
jgi:hypothetical protein